MGLSDLQVLERLEDALLGPGCGAALRFMFEQEIVRTDSAEARRQHKRRRENKNQKSKINTEQRGCSWGWADPANKFWGE